MALRKNRSNSVKTVRRRTPAGRVAVHFKRGRHAPLRCRLCGTLLGGVKTGRRASKSERVPSRIFAGELCGACVSGIVKAKARIRAGAAKPEDYGFAEREFIAMMRSV